MTEDNKNNSIFKKVKDQVDNVENKISGQLKSNNLKNEFSEERKNLNSSLQNFYKEEEILNSGETQSKENFYSAVVSRDKVKGGRNKLTKPVSNINQENKKNITNSSFIPRSLKKGFSSFESARDDILEESGVYNQEDLQEAQLNSDKNKGRIKVVNKKRPEKSNKAGLALDKLLQRAFMYAIPTWTLSMFYVYIHAFLSFLPIGEKFFCKLGHEWVPARIKMKTPEKAKEVGDRIGVFEKPAVGCFCGCHIFLIVIVIAIIYFILNPWSVAWSFLEEIAKAAWEATKGWLGFGDD